MVYLFSRYINFYSEIIRLYYSLVYFFVTVAHIAQLA